MKLDLERAALHFGAELFSEIFFFQLKSSVQILTVQM